ncbi:MAG: hypothetical protein GY711_34820 [bacterium]|nr:hypothetical protein [bacterium]
MRCIALLAIVAVQACTAPAQSWSATASGLEFLLLDAEFTDARDGVAVGGDREHSNPHVLARTTDGGATWRPVATETDARLYAVHFPTRRTGYAVGFAGTFLATDDGGASWQRRESGTETWLAGTWFTNRTVGYVVGGSALDGVLLRTRDGGRSFESLTPNVPKAGRAASYRDVCFTDEHTGFVVGTSGTLLTTFDAGATWTRVATDTSDWLRAVHFPTPRTGFVLAARGALLVTRDGGRTWSTLPGPSGGKFNDVAFANENEGWATTMQGNLHHTTNGGLTWRVVHETGGTELVGIVPEIGLCVGGKGTVLRRETRSQPRQPLGCN